MDPRSHYDRGAWASRRPPSDAGDGTEAEPEPGGEPGGAAASPGQRAAHADPSEGLIPLESLTIEELQRELDRRQGELKRMLSRRNRLAQQLAELEARIKALGGDAGSTARGDPRRVPGAAGEPRPKRTRSKNEISLSDAIAMAVEVRATVTPTEVAQLVQANGYRSTSQNFAMMVANALAKDKRFRRITRGQYERIA
jgi:hypothetical protein